METENQYDLICVGGGIMSANLALLTKILDPNKRILIIERLDDVAKESSAALNNAGTGHSALCELNYTPEKKDGTIDINKAVDICEQFEISKQLWSYLTEQQWIDNPSDFVMPTKHHSWVLGKNDAIYLEKRYNALKKHYMFENIEFTRDVNKMKEWFPLISKNRTSDEIMAASRIDRGVEMNFEVLTHEIFNILNKRFDTKVKKMTNVFNIDKSDNGWFIDIKNLKTKVKQRLKTKKIFLGAGGGSLSLLQNIGIPESKGYGGFPVGGEFLICTNKALIDQHDAKVYSKAGLGAPPMSTPHLDTRYLNGEKALLFGPFAGFNPKFLKKGSNLDLIKSIKFGNIIPMLQVFVNNLGLSKYLIHQILMSKKDKVKVLSKFIKNADPKDWKVVQAGQRVQIIKKIKGKGILQFGTEVLSNEDGSITCLLGASPGASTATAIMLEVLEEAFPKLINSEEGKSKLNEVVPFYKKQLTEELFKKELVRCKELLKL